MRSLPRRKMVGMVSMMRVITVLMSTELSERSLGMVMLMSILLVISTDLAIHFESSVFSSVSHSFHYTLQAIAVLDVDFIVLVGVISYGALFLVDQVFDLSKLAPQVIQLSQIFFYSRMMLRHSVVGSKGLRVGVCDDLIRNREISLDVHDLRKTRLSEQHRKSSILHSFSIYIVDGKLQQLRIRNPVDSNAVEVPRSDDDAFGVC